MYSAGSRLYPGSIPIQRRNPVLDRFRPLERSSKDIALNAVAPRTARGNGKYRANIATSVALGRLSRCLSTIREAAGRRDHRLPLPPASPKLPTIGDDRNSRPDAESRRTKSVEAARNAGHPTDHRSQS